MFVLIRKWNIQRYCKTIQFKLTVTTPKVVNLNPDYSQFNGRSIFLEQLISKLLKTMLAKIIMSFLCSLHFVIAVANTVQFAFLSNLLCFRMLLCARCDKQLSSRINMWISFDINTLTNFSTLIHFYKGQTSSSTIISITRHLIRRSTFTF